MKTAVIVFPGSNCDRDVAVALEHAADGICLNALGSKNAITAGFPGAPPEAVKNWPLIGEQFFNFWALASTNLHSALKQILPQFNNVLKACVACHLEYKLRSS